MHPYVNDMSQCGKAVESRGVLLSLASQRISQHVLHLAYILFSCHAASDVAD